MPRPAVNFSVYIPRIPQHGGALASEAGVPSRHYTRAANDAWNLLLYMHGNLEAANVYAASRDRHLQSLRVMVLLTLVEAFERFLKETAVACIDETSAFIADDRLNIFSVRGDVLRAHFGAGTLGQCLCEPMTWCDCDQVNDRFRRILAEPFESGNFYVFPKSAGQGPASLRGNYDLTSIIWQLRHSIVHNRGAITSSDAQKLRVLCRAPIAAPVMLHPTRGDVWYVKLFLDGLVERITTEIAGRVAALLTTILAVDPALFAAAEKAQAIADVFQVPVTIGGYTQTPVSLR